ncbi:MAG TPA: LysR family transcriptional regulator [Streptosporangiaceae bacterium]|nr:LysR family transcriptional regulator [Streptosporangiaceae bacterium]
MEFRQLRFFVTLAEELHFGRAAAREHIVQSALSQQIQRLERELGVRLLDRSTHHVALTSAGAAFLTEARQILASAQRAAAAARQAGDPAPVLQVGIVDAGYNSMPQILRAVQERFPNLEIHQVEACVPDQFTFLADGRIDVGLGRALHAPGYVASELVRLDPLGVLVADSHPFAALEAVPVAMLAEEPLLLSPDGRAPEFNQFVAELCRSVGFVPSLYRGSVHSIRGAADLIDQGRCLACVPASYASEYAGIVWRPLTAPPSLYPWSVLWRADDDSEHVRAVVACARALADELDWLKPADQVSG